MAHARDPHLPHLPSELIDKILLEGQDDCKAVGRYCTIKKCSSEDWERYLNEWYNLTAPRADQAKKMFKSFCVGQHGTFYTMGQPRRNLKAHELRPGMIVAHNTLWRGGHHYSWEFFKLVKITPSGLWSAKKLTKERVPNAPNSLTADYSRFYVRPGAEVEGGRAQRLPNHLYYIWDPQYEADRDNGLFDGGVRY